MSSFAWPATQPGSLRDARPIEWQSEMKALVYFAKRRMEVVGNRPIVCTDEDIVARVDRVHRCGTDVKMFQSGRPDQVEESLFEELKSITGCTSVPGDISFADYVNLAFGNRADSQIADPLYRELATKIEALVPEQRKALPEQMRRHWGRIFGHETVVTIERVGSRVKDLKTGIGYLEGTPLSAEYLDFQPGEKCVLQSRIAHYEPVPATLNQSPSAARGVQLLGGNITDLAMNLGGAYAQSIRLTPEIIASGSVIRVPNGVAPEAAALCEPAGCLLDCFQKTTHEFGQDDSGSMLMKGVKEGGTVCVMGSGSMALMCAMFSRMDDPVIRMGRAREIVYIVRSEAKADFVHKILAGMPVRTVICDSNPDIAPAIHEQYAPYYWTSMGREFRGFDDIILAAGDAGTVAASHDIIAPTGGRIMTFAGTRGKASIESGVWHYGNAGVLGTSGCNTKMMEVVLGLFARKSIDPIRLSGKLYTFADLEAEGGVEAFHGGQESEAVSGTE